MSHVESSVLDEIEKQKPSYAPFLLSSAEKDRLIRRGLYGLYRWYVDRSQAKRNWNSDRSFDWRKFGKNHSTEMLAIIEGFYAVEQYVPDYTSEILRASRTNYGVSQFQLRWGAEEERHADLWRNMLLFSGQRTPEQIEQYTSDLRLNAWVLPTSHPIEMILYTVFQERATQFNYLNLAKVGRGESDKPQFVNDADPVLVEACKTIAMDEAAHYDFFLEGARLYLYYYPEETLKALVTVLRNFVMPAAHIIPDYDKFIQELYDGGIFGPRMYAREIVPNCLAKLGVDSIRDIERGVKRSRQVPDAEGQIRDTAIFDASKLEGIRFSVVEDAVIRIINRINRYEDEVGLAEVDPTQFVPTCWGRFSQADEAPSTLF